MDAPVTLLLPVKKKTTPHKHSKKIITIGFHKDLSPATISVGCRVVGNVEKKTK